MSDHHVVIPVHVRPDPIHTIYHITPIKKKPLALEIAGGFVSCIENPLINCILTLILGLFAFILIFVFFIEILIYENKTKKEFFTRTLDTRGDHLFRCAGGLFSSLIHTVVFLIIIDETSS